MSLVPERQRQEPCGCRYDAPTGIRTHLCEQHALASAPSTKAKPKWIRFEGPRPSVSGKTQIWAVMPTEAGHVGPVGFIGWYGKWRRYAFQPEPNTVFEQDCLRDIAAFCEERTRAHKQARS